MTWFVVDMSNRVIAIFPTQWEAERKASILNMGSDTNSFRITKG